EAPSKAQAPAADAAVPAPKIQQHPQQQHSSAPVPRPPPDSKHAGQGGQRARTHYVESGNWLLFEVMDTGMGISHQGLQALFKEYVQGTEDDMKKPRTRGGTGLGLSICSKQVGVLGGRIGAYSCPDQGSVFWFAIPLLLPPNTPPLPPIPSPYNQPQIPSHMSHSAQQHLQQQQQQQQQHALQHHQQQQEQQQQQAEQLVEQQVQQEQEVLRRRAQQQQLQRQQHQQEAEVAFGSPQQLSYASTAQNSSSSSCRNASALQARLSHSASVGSLDPPASLNHLAPAGTQHPQHPQQHVLPHFEAPGASLPHELLQRRGSRRRSLEVSRQQQQLHEEQQQQWQQQPCECKSKRSSPTAPRTTRQRRSWDMVQQQEQQHCPSRCEQCEVRSGSPSSSAMACASRRRSLEMSRQQQLEEGQHGSPKARHKGLQSLLGLDAGPADVTVPLKRRSAQLPRTQSNTMPQVMSRTSSGECCGQPQQQGGGGILPSRTVSGGVASSSRLGSCGDLLGSERKQQQQQQQSGSRRRSLDPRSGSQPMTCLAGAGVGRRGPRRHTSAMCLMTPPPSLSAPNPSAKRLRRSEKVTTDEAVDRPNSRAASPAAAVSASGSGAGSAAKGSPAVKTPKSRAGKALLASLRPQPNSAPAILPPSLQHQLCADHGHESSSETAQQQASPSAPRPQQPEQVQLQQQQQQQPLSPGPRERGYPAIATGPCATHESAPQFSTAAITPSPSITCSAAATPAASALPPAAATAVAPATAAASATPAVFGAPAAAAGPAAGSAHVPSSGLQQATPPLGMKGTNPSLTAPPPATTSAAATAAAAAAAAAPSSAAAVAAADAERVAALERRLTDARAGDSLRALLKPAPNTAPQLLTPLASKQITRSSSSTSNLTSLAPPGKSDASGANSRAAHLHGSSISSSWWAPSSSTPRASTCTPPTSHPAPGYAAGRPPLGTIKDRVDDDSAPAVALPTSEGDTDVGPADAAAHTTSSATKDPLAVLPPPTPETAPQSLSPGRSEPQFLLDQEEPLFSRSSLRDSSCSLAQSTAGTAPLAAAAAPPSFESWAHLTHDPRNTDGTSAPTPMLATPIAAAAAPAPAPTPAPAPATPSASRTCSSACLTPPHPTPAGIPSPPPCWLTTAPAPTPSPCGSMPPGTVPAPSAPPTTINTNSSLTSPISPCAPHPHLQPPPSSQAATATTAAVGPPPPPQPKKLPPHFTMSLHQPPLAAQRQRFVGGRQHVP
ncbi:hypothetical protein DUNSADRAFT_14566, partial [Dunaliella salina]